MTNNAIGTAYRIHKRDAAKFFKNGATIAVSDRGHEETFDVFQYTYAHNRETATWEWLTEQVDTWRNRYPNQRYYLVVYGK